MKDTNFRIEEKANRERAQMKINFENNTKEISMNLVEARNKIELLNEELLEASTKAKDYKHKFETAFLSLK